MKWQNSAEYLEQRADLENLKKIAAELGTSNPATEAGELVLLEMRLAAWEQGADERLATLLSGLVYKWKKEKNTFYMDQALLLCTANGLTPSPALMAAITEAAAHRYEVGHVALKSTADSIKRDDNKWSAFTIMMNLIFNGDTLERAASKTAQWMQDVLKVKPIKASSLDKYYVKEVRKTGIEGQYFENWRKWSDEETKQQWKRMIDLLPEALYWDKKDPEKPEEADSKYLKGIRR